MYLCFCQLNLLVDVILWTWFFFSCSFVYLLWYTYKLTFVESLQSHCIPIQSHWSSGSPVCFQSRGTRVQSPGGYLCETRILLLALYRYISDPGVIDHCGLVCGGLHPEPSLGHSPDNVIIPRDLTQLFCLGFTLSL